MSENPQKPVSGLSIDVEDYWSIVSRDWLDRDAEPTEAVVRNTEWFLETLANHNVKATFFVLGEVAQKFPSLVKAIAQDSHEIGVHGYLHKQIFKLTRDQFWQEVDKCKKLLEDTISAPVLGHRAPAFSVIPETRWALDVLAQADFKYDSSVFPIAGRRYGWPGFSQDICRTELPSGRSIVEVPMSTVSILRRALPAGGGGYIRHLPYALTRWSMKRIQRDRPVIVYMHPYEIETDRLPLQTSHLSASAKATAIRFHKLQFRNRRSMPRKICRLLREFDFTTVWQVIENTGLSE